MKTTLLFSTMAALLALTTACGDGDNTGTDGGLAIDLGGQDLGGGITDAGPRDSARPDAAGDPCFATVDNASDTIGCNGDVLGSDVADNAFGGRCTITIGDGGVEEDSCTDPEDFCFVLEDGMPGYCTRTCPFTAGQGYVSTGGCPSGSRCFEPADGDEGLCYTDCEVQEDCLTMGAEFWCDGDGACEPPPPPADEDAGMPDLDAGAPDAASATDAGAADAASATDAGDGTDAGEAMDAGPPA
ncbi:MAG: hypothetical protein IPK60_17250 [Sandaracinaceae bacterium]|nr:hypothetical protein [Sandaracinaceae bacterium]